jgi:ABC-type amino acid transport substrate-binding protein
MKKGVFFVILALFLAGSRADTIKIAVRVFKPMAECEEGSSITNLELSTASSTEAAKWDGFDIDMIEEVAFSAGWESWTLYCVSLEDLKAGVKSGEYFMGIGGIPITSEDMRNGFDFSLPSYTAGLKLAVRNDIARGLWSFLKSFDVSLWLMIVLTTFVTGGLAWLFEEQKLPCSCDRRCRRNLFEMVWQAFCSLFYTSEIRLQKFSSRVIFLCFWFMVLVLTATYTADLTTKLATKTPKAQYDDIEEAKKAGVKIGTYDEERYIQMLSDQEVDQDKIELYEMTPAGLNVY